MAARTYTQAELDERVELGKTLTSMNDALTTLSTGQDEINTTLKSGEVVCKGHRAKVEKRINGLFLVVIILAVIVLGDKAPAILKLLV